MPNHGTTSKFAVLSTILMLSGLNPIEGQQNEAPAEPAQKAEVPSTPDGNSPIQKIRTPSPRQAALFQVKKQELTETLNMIVEVHRRFKYNYTKFQEYKKEKPEMYGLYDNNDIRVRYDAKDKPTIRMRLDFVQTRDSQGFRIVFIREVNLFFDNYDLKKVEILIESFRQETREMHLKKKVTINPADLDTIVGEKTLDNSTEVLKLSDGDLAWDTRRRMIEQYGRTMQEVANRLERLSGAYDYRFYNDTKDQGADLEDFIEVIK